MNRTEEHEEIEKLCRRNAHVPFQEKAYSSGLREIQEALEASHQQYFSAEREKTLESLKKGLESVSQDERGWKEKVSSFFRSRDELERTKELGEQLLSKRSQLQEFETLVKEIYNQESKFLYVIGSSLRKLLRLNEAYTQELSHLGEEVKELQQVLPHPEMIYERLEQLIAQKEEAEKKTLSPEDRLRIKQALLDAGEARFQERCASYLQLRHDEKIGESLITAYAPLASSNEGAVILLDELVGYSCKQVAAVQAVLNVYQAVTHQQLCYLTERSLSPQFIEKVNALADQIAAVDKQAEQRVLEQLFERAPRVKLLGSSDEIVPGVVEAIRTAEEGKK
ncbi:hypothetical protein HZC30_03870 [Candidatus Woesearchaeota archaeon]|nr:hypothetical protein [Candidatus Woesearchaeota archaeon]